MSYLYLGQPYTAINPDGSPCLELMEWRYEQGAKVTASLLNKGIFVYSPIVHCHELAKKFEMPRDFAFWQDYNFAMLAKAKAIIVLELPGWEDSLGLKGEIQFTKSLGRSVMRIKEEDI
jgi:hypothetical protein